MAVNLSQASTDGFDAIRSRITVSARMRPLLDSEASQGLTCAPWELTDSSVALRDRTVGHSSVKTRSELRNIDHLRRDDSETVMDAVFGGDATTQEVYEQSFREIVAGACEGLNGAILAYGQTSSGKTYSISGTSASSGRSIDDDSTNLEPAHKGIIHFALEDLFEQMHAKASASANGSCEYLVRMSYCELYMERVNDLLRKISPQTQNLPVKEDPESKSFFVEGLKEKIVSSPEEVHALLMQAEKRRRVAYTRYNDVSSRSHTLLTLYIECSMPLDDTDGSSLQDSEETRVTKVSRLTIVDLAGNERMELGTEYMAESSSINKSLFFLGKVVEKLAGKEGVEAARHEHVPFRDSKLTRLLSVHLGGNSQTGLLVTLTPLEEFIEDSMTTLRFAQKASTIRCVAKPVLVSKEQSLIVKQREIIAQLHQQVRELTEAKEKQEFAQPNAATDPTNTSESDVSIERQQRVEQLQALTLGSGAPNGQAFVSKSREVDAIVTALHRNNEALRNQKATVLEEFRSLHAAVAALARETVQVTSDLKSCASRKALVSDCFQQEQGVQETKAWEPAMQDLRIQLRQLLQSLCIEGPKEVHKVAVPVPSSARASPRSSPRDLTSANVATNLSRRNLIDDFSGNTTDVSKTRDVERQLREENMRLRASVKYLNSERERLKTEMEKNRSSSTSRPSETPCKRSDGTGKPGTANKDTERLQSPSRKSVEAVSVGQRSPEVCPEVASRPSSSKLTPGGIGKWSLGSPTRAARQDFEPIIERCQAKPSGQEFGDFDVEPIVERCGLASPVPPAMTAPKPPAPKAGPPKPPENQRGASVSDVAPRITMDYFRQVGVRTNWKVGDTAFWRGQECKVTKVVGEDTPLYVVLRTPAGSEVTTDLCLLSDSPPSNSISGMQSPQDGADNGRPLRLAPLVDLYVDRPPALDRPLAMDKIGSEQMAKQVGNQRDASWSLQAIPSTPDKLVGRSSSLPARGLSPVRPPSRQNTANRLRCSSPVASLTSNG